MKHKKPHLGNPAAVMVAQKTGNSEVAKQVTSTIPFAVKTGIVVGLGALAYRIITTRFKKKAEVSNYPAANITMGQAKSKAAAIYKSTGHIYSDFENIKNQFSGVNYNGLVRIYNAFGQVGNIITGYLDMDQYLQSRLSEDHLMQLRFLTSGAWFKQAPAQSQTLPAATVATKPLLDTEANRIQFSGI